MSATVQLVEAQSVWYPSPFRAVEYSGNMQNTIVLSGSESL